MKIPKSSTCLVPVLTALLISACGSVGPVPGAPCEAAAECGPTGDAVCIEGHCQAFDEAIGWGSASINLSFKSDLYQAATSGYVTIVLDQRPDGTALSCEDILAANATLDDSMFNPLQSNPKYLVFHWSSGGTFFPNNLVQFIRPADRALAVATGYTGLDGAGSLSAIGCEPAAGEEPITILADETAEFTIQLVAP